MIQMHHTDKYLQHSSIIWSVWLNVWVFVYELSGCEFKPSCSHLDELVSEDKGKTDLTKCENGTVYVFKIFLIYTYIYIYIHM